MHLQSVLDRFDQATHSIQKFIALFAKSKTSHSILEKFLKVFQLNDEYSYKFFAFLNLHTADHVKLDALSFALAIHWLNLLIKSAEDGDKKRIIFR